MTSKSGINLKKEMHRLIKHSKHPMFTYRTSNDSYEFSPFHMREESSYHDSNGKFSLQNFINKNSTIIASAAIGLIGAAAIGMSMQKAPKKKSWVSVIGRMM
ncbi:hypothetical protein [Clostridium oryzae]|uniref:Uncharacterized protein n=1 Tax=Clostridium oryzae TaxID=1450648 RepID=A0A1V4INR9_9CLOT|nr:hypothetical protein [Clostridium oryzae]OPJ61556.1 hypothetical protein CLORY_22380 [Clostridium oryzae]